MNDFNFYSPYLSADMRKMAAAFNTSVHSLEDELILLILDGQIQARIDSHNQVCSVCFMTQMYEFLVLLELISYPKLFDKNASRECFMRFGFHFV